MARMTEGTGGNIPLSQSQMFAVKGGVEYSHLSSMTPAAGLYIIAMNNRGI